MPTTSIAQVLNELSGAARGQVDLENSVRVLDHILSVGDIHNSSGVAIGSNIRMVVNQLNLTPESVGALLTLRTRLGAQRAIDSDPYNFKTLLIDKTRHFVGREYVFSAIEAFLGTHPKGYFIVEGDPGMGKSAILAEYVRRTGCICHFNLRATGFVTATQFLESICTQIIVDAGLPYSSLPANAGCDGTYLAKLLVEAADKLSAGERLVIAVDAIDEVDLTGHPKGANILYLPKVLPDAVYLILTRRDVDIPFVVETPQHTLKLLKHQEDNRKDVELYILRNVERAGIRSWIAGQKRDVTKEDFVRELADLSENNFMYLYYVLSSMEAGVYQNVGIDQLPAGLQGYYQDHWRHMGMTAAPLPRLKIRLIYIMCEVRQAVSRGLLARLATDVSMQVDELTVQEILDEWKQFLHRQPINDEVRYAVYHSSFRDFLHRKDIVRAAGVTIRQINELIADKLWDSAFASDN